MSPRKSSTSSGRPRPARPRYLGLEVAGELLPSAARAWEPLLRDRLDRSGLGSVPFHVVRAEGARAIVEVGHRDAAAAREAWSVADPAGRGPTLAPRRTWGTLVGAKEWLRSGRRPGPP